MKIFIETDCGLIFYSNEGRRSYTAYEYDGKAYLEDEETEQLYICEVGESFNFIDMPLFVNEDGEWEEC